MQQNKTALVQLVLTTLGQETRWAYSTTLPSPHGAQQATGRETASSEIVTEYCVKKGKGSPYWITERRVPELIPVLGSRPAGDMSHKPGGRLPLLSARPAVTLASIKRAAADFVAW